MRGFLIPLLVAGALSIAPTATLFSQTLPPVPRAAATDVAAGDAPPSSSPELRGAPRVGEVRALWVVRTTLSSPQGIRTMVREAAAAGFNTLMVQVRGRGDAFYSSTIEPRAEALAGESPDFDP